MHVIELIEQSAAQLETSGVSYGHGTTNSFDEAVWLVLWSLQLPLDDPESVENRPVGSDGIARVASILGARISSKKPAAYLTQEAWLQGVPFYVDERAIVPRSFIAELLVDGAIDPWLSPQTRFALDLCSGNGSLAVLTALTYPDIRVDAADISIQALEVAKINIAKHHLEQRINPVVSDGLAACTGPYDLVVCNPPYVNSQTMRNLPAEYLAEPRIALAGGTDGMDFIRPLLRDLPGKLTENGVLVLEIGNERAFFESAFPQLDVVWLETSAGEDQVLLLTRQSLQ